MTLPNPPAEKLNKNVREVRRLLSIHQQIAGKTPGRKHNLEILNKSAIVLLTACWEAFIEDICNEALEFTMLNAKDHRVFLTHVLDRVASRHNGIKAWDLADKGWKKCMRDNLAEVLAKTTGALNTPKTAQVNELFSKTIGLGNLSSHWKWKGRSANSSSKALDELVTLRGSIAHRVDANQSVRKTHVNSGIELIFRLSVKSSNAIRSHVHSLANKYPWASRRFKETR